MRIVLTSKNFFSFSKIFSRYKIAKYFGVLMLLHYEICICISGHSKFNIDWNLFFHDRFYITLLIIMCIRMFNLRY